MSVKFGIPGAGASVQDASTTVKGIVRLATIAEASGNSQSIAVTPAGVQAAIAGIVGGMTYKGPYDVAIASPDISYGEKGDFYIISNVKVNPTDTNTTFDRYGKEWAVGDHLIINEDLSGTIADDQIEKVDNTEKVQVLNDLLDVTTSLESIGQVLIHDGTDFKNRVLTTADIVGIATRLPELLDVTLNELSSAVYSSTTSALSLVHSRDYTIDLLTGESKTLTLPSSLNDDEDLIRVVNMGDGEIELQVTGAAVFNVGGSPSTTPITVTTQKELTIVGQVEDLGGTNYVAWTVTEAAIPSRQSLVREGSSLWTNGFLTAADIVGVVTQGQLAAVQQEVDAIETGAGLNSDGTLTPFGGNFISGNTTLKQAISSLDSALYTEQQARISADTTLQNNINAEATARANADTNLQNQINAEASIRASADTNLQNQIDALATVATTGAAADVSVAHTAVAYTPTSADVEAHIVGIDGVLNTVLSTNVLSVNGETPTLGDVTLDGTHIDSLTTATNYTAATADIDAHLSGINTKLGTLDTADTTEATARANADTNLQNQIDALATVASTGAAADVSVAHTATSYTPTSADVEAHIVGIDGQLSTLGSQIVTDVNGEAPVNGSVTLNAEHIDSAHTAVNYTAAAADVDSHISGIDTKLGELQNAENIDSAHTAVNYTAAAADVDSHISGIDTKLGEVDAIETGAGLNADGTYTANPSANYIASVASLKAADDALDTQLKSTQDEVDAIETGAGLNTDGTYSAPAGTNYLGSATSLSNADVLLDAQIALINVSQVNTVNSQSPDVSGNVTVDGSQIDSTHTAVNYTAAAADLDSHVAGIDTKLGDIQTEVDAIETGAGLNADGTYTANGGAIYISGATSLKSADNALDSALATAYTRLGVVEDSAVYTITSGSTTLSVTPTTNDLVIDADDLEATHAGVNYTGLSTDSVATHLGGIDTAIGLKAPIDSPTFTTAANAPTPSAGDNSTSVATTAFVATELANLTTTAQGTAGTMQTSDGSGGFASSQWEVDTTSGHFRPKANETYDLGTSAARVRDLYLSASSIKMGASSIEVGLTDGAHAQGADHVKTTDGVVAICNTDVAVTDPVLALVAHTGSYTDLIDAPESLIQTASFDTTVGTYNLNAGQHHTYFPPTSGTMTLILPDSVTGSGGDHIRVTNWGNGELKITTSGSSANTWIQYGQTLSQAQTGGGAQPEFIVEARTTLDLYGWSYSSGGTTYDPAWGVYFAPSIELNTKNLTTSGQMLVYDATNEELVAGGLSDLTFSFSPVNYDNTRGGTVTGDTVEDHLGGIDDKFADISLDELTDVDATVASATSGKMLLHDGVNFKPVTHDLDSLTDVDTTSTAPVTNDLLKFDGSNFVPATLSIDDLSDVDTTTTAPTTSDVLTWNGSSWVPDTATTTVASLGDIGDVDLTTTAPVSGDFLKYDGTNWINDGSSLAPSVTVSSPSTTQTLSAPSGIEEVYIYTPSASINVNLVAAATCGSGFKYQIKNRSTNTININPHGSETIDGAANFSLVIQNSSLTLISDGSNWFVI